MAASRVLTVLLLLLLAPASLSPALAQSRAAPADNADQPAAIVNGNKSPRYRINAGDQLEVFVWGEERLQRQVRVLPDGSFSFPLVGRVEAEGKLPSDIEGIVSKGLKSQFRGDVPQVTVSVVNPAGLQFSIMGKVRNPGTFNTGRYINLLDALSFAGGPSDFAQLGSILIVRKDGEN